MNIPISKLKPGLTLAKEVITHLGGTLYLKGHQLDRNDLFVLKAFMIEKVTVVQDDQASSLQSEHNGLNNSVDKQSENVHVQKKDQSKKQKRHVRDEKQEKQKWIKGLDRLIQQKYFDMVNNTKGWFQYVRNGQSLPVSEITEHLYPFIRDALQHPHFVILLAKLGKSNEYLYHHSVAVSVLFAFIAEMDGWSEDQIIEGSLAGLLHNIGETQITDELLYKPTALTHEEYQLIQKHTTIGYQLLKGIEGVSEGVIYAALQHHEREDGSGYPLGFKQDKIHPYAKIIAIVDIYFAMCSERVYKKAISPFKVVEQIKNDSFGRLNPTYVHHFIKCITRLLSVGKRVELSNGNIGEIVYVDQNTTTRPLVNVNGQVINLQQEKELHIEQFI